MHPLYRIGSGKYCKRANKLLRNWREQTVKQLFYGHALTKAIIKDHWRDCIWPENLGRELQELQDLGKSYKINHTTCEATQRYKSTEHFYNQIVLKYKVLSNIMHSQNNVRNAKSLVLPQKYFIRQGWGPSVFSFNDLFMWTIFLKFFIEFVTILLLFYALFFGHEVCRILGLCQLQGLMNTHSTSENDKLMAYAKGGRV